MVRNAVVSTRLGGREQSLRWKNSSSSVRSAVSTPRQDPRVGDQLVERDLSQAPIGLAFLSLGGVIGGIVLLLLAARKGITFALMVMPAIGAVSMVAAATVGTDHTALLLALAGSGAGVTASQIGQLTLAVAMYSSATRTAGVGWAAALGRVDSIVGPATAGILLALSLPGDDIVLLTAIPVVVAAVSAAVLWRLPHAADRTGGAEDAERKQREVTAR